MSGLRYQVEYPPGVGPTSSWQDRVKIRDIQPSQASFTDYRRQLGRGALTFRHGYARLSEVIDVDPTDHSNDVGSLVSVWRPAQGPYPETLVAEWVVANTPDELTEADLYLPGDAVEVVMDWAIVEPHDWDGTVDFQSDNPDWIYGGRDLIPDLALGDLGSVREEWSLYLSGERYELDVSAATSGTFTLTVLGDTTGALAWNISATAIRSALEGLASVTAVSVIQADPDTREYVVVFENPKDLGSDMTANFGSLNVPGSLTKLNDGFNTGANPTFTITVDGQTTDPLAWDASPAVVEGTPLIAGAGLEGLSTVNDVTVSGTGIGADPWQITFYDPPDPTTVTVTFAAGTAVLIKLQEGDPSPRPVTVSQSVDASRNPTIHGTYDDPPVEVDTSVVNTGSDWSAKVNATGRFAGSQIVLNGVNPGQTYQASIPIRPTVTGLYTIVVRDQFENLIATTSPRDNLLTAGTFQTLQIADVVIPEGVTQVIFRAAVTDTDAAAWADFYVDWQGAEFREGMAPATVGQIMLELLQDCQVDHAGWETIPFINPTFDESTDSAGTPWPSVEAVNIQRGQTLRRVLDVVFGRKDYEWSVTRNASAGVWDLNIWGPGSRGTDHTAAASPSLLIGQGTTYGTAAMQLPRANSVMVEGSQQSTSRVEDAGSVSSIGRRRAYKADVTYLQGLDEWAADTLDRFLDESYAPSFDIADGADWPVPIVAYGLADSMTVDTGVRRVARQVETVGFTDTAAEGLRWVVQFGQSRFGGITGTGSAAGSPSGAAAGGGVGLGALGPVAEGVRRLIEQLDRLPDREEASVFTPGGAGGAPTIVIAPANAHPIEKEKADLIAGGNHDEETLAQALEIIHGQDSNRGGRILITSGTLNVSPDTAIFLGENVTLQGMGRYETVIATDRTSGTTMETGNDCMVRDLMFDVSAPAESPDHLFLGGNHCIVDNVHFEHARAAIRGGERATITRCSTLFCTIFVDASSGYSGITIALSVPNSAGNGAADIILGPSGDSWLITNNMMAGQIYTDTATDRNGLIISHNVWTSNVDGSNDAVITLEGALGVVVAYNVVEDGVGYDFMALRNIRNSLIVGNRADNITAGISLDGCDRILVADNLLGDQYLGEYGLLIDDCGHSEFRSNRIHEPGQDTANTYDGITLLGESDENYLHANRVIPHANTRYGINVSASTCVCNIVVGNVLGDPVSYGSDALNDAGTDTRLTYPADPTYGDNFTACDGSS